jgi:hypothetical protein
MSNFPLRLPETLMSEAREMAEAEGVSINQFLATLIAERIGEMKGLSQVRARIERGNPVRARAILGRAPARKPAKADEMPAKRSRKA